LRGLVLAGLIAILMSSMAACYNSSATLVVRDFVLRARPGLAEAQQVKIGRWVTALMAVLGVLAAPLVGLSVTIWHYLQFISAYLSVPMSAVIFIGLLWKRGNTQGAIAGVVAGFSAGVVFFLDQTLKWSLPVLEHPYMNSFLHRSLVVWTVAALVMIGVSLATRPPAQEKVEGNVFTKVSSSNLGLADYRLWAGVLFGCTLVLWWTFR
jgi:Na+/proline symporter